MPTERTPVTAKDALFSFYDIESLANVFSLVSFTPRPDGPDTLEIFFLCDDDNIYRAVDPAELLHVVQSSNPALDTQDCAISLWNLRRQDANERLAEIVGLCDADQVCHRSDASSYPERFRLVCDTDEEYDPRKHPFLAGYNSQNYDTTMLALYLSEAFPAPHTDRLFQPTTARIMRDHNDQLFSEQHIEYMPKYLGWDSPAGKIRMSMLRSGRHLDVARLNELQFKVGLKRLLGMLGGQIKESDRLSHDTTLTSVEELYELLAYNVSDCVGLSQLFRDTTYSSAFDLKAGLLAQYEECRFTKTGAVRRDRLTIDSSSAKFVGRILAPYEALGDIETVSFTYPHPEVAKEQGTRSVNVLEECLSFFLESVTPDLVVDRQSLHAANAASYPAQADALEQFAHIVRYYRSIEGKNFNASENYAENFSQPVHELRTLPKLPSNIPYFRSDASPSSCFATFSTGGIHGAEVDMTTFQAELALHQEHAQMLKRARQLFPDARDFVAAAADQHNALRLPDGYTVDKRRVLLGSDPQKVRYRKPKKEDPTQVEQLRRATEQVPDPADLLAAQRPEEQKLDVRLSDGTVLLGKVVLKNTSAKSAAYREEVTRKRPVLFPTNRDDEATKLHPKFARTSAGLVVHEDFTSYYPNLLRNMRAFYNPELGEDRYAKIFFDKERYGRQMKQPGISPEEKARLNTLRNGTKLILNSASGAGDAGHDTPIRMNNRIISMRIIGQLLSWRIGQAQTLQGARIISTNTDGLYSVVGKRGFTQEVNNTILAQQSASIGVEIEPELMFLISKDSNNRLELAPPGSSPEEQALIDPSRVLRADGGFTLDGLEIHAAGGGTLACHAGPRMDKSLAHPAVTDFALARYLWQVVSRGENALAEPFDEALGRKIIAEALDQDDPVMTLRLFQNIITASRGSITYPFAAEPIDSDATEITITAPRALQMINRVFVVRAGTPGAVSLHNAGAWKVPAEHRDKRQANGEPRVRRDQIAMDILRAHGWARSRAEAAGAAGLSLLPDDQDVLTRRINGIDPTWSMLVVNDDLHTLSAAQRDKLIAALDLDIYLQMLQATFEKNWRNAA